MPKQYKDKEYRREIRSVAWSLQLTFPYSLEGYAMAAQAVFPGLTLDCAVNVTPGSGGEVIFSLTQPQVASIPWRTAGLLVMYQQGVLIENRIRLERLPDTS